MGKSTDLHIHAPVSIILTPTLYHPLTLFIALEAPLLITKLALCATAVSLPLLRVVAVLQQSSPVVWWSLALIQTHHTTLIVLHLTKESLSKMGGFGCLPNSRCPIPDLEETKCPRAGINGALHVTLYEVLSLQRSLFCCVRGCALQADSSRIKGSLESAREYVKRYRVALDFCGL